MAILNCKLCKLLHKCAADSGEFFPRLLVGGRGQDAMPHSLGGRGRLKSICVGEKGWIS